MKNILFILFLVTFELFAQTSQSISLNDEGPVIVDKTCTLKIDQELVGEKSFRDSDLDEAKVILAKKGYRVTQEESRIALSLYYNKNFKEQYFSAKLTSKVYDNELSGFDLMPTYKSNNFKNAVNDDHYYLELNNKAKRSLKYLVEKLPSCKTLDSVHHYEVSHYNPSLVMEELNSCEEAIDGVSYTPETSHDIQAQMFVGTYGGASSLLIGVLMPSPLFLGIGLGVTSYIAIRAINKHKRKYFRADNIAFYQNVRSCYELLQAGKVCEGDYGDYLTKDLSKKARKEVNKFLSHMSSSELTIKIADYLALNRPCSTQLAKLDKINKKRKSIRLKNVLNKVKGSL